MSDRKAVIKNADMGEEMQQDAVDCATQALEKYNIEKVCTAGRKGEKYGIEVIMKGACGNCEGKDDFTQGTMVLGVIKKTESFLH
uniref:Dynein light chain n=1 Tax=Anopheles stephensi TaxID=30069 RepID=A0A182YGA5_ANOST